MKVKTQDQEGKTLAQGCLAVWGQNLDQNKDLNLFSQIILLILAQTVILGEGAGLEERAEERTTLVDAPRSEEVVVAV